MNPTMPTLAVLAALPLLPAQESTHDVVPGRDFHHSKLLSPGLTDVWNLDVERDEMLWCAVDSNAFDPVLELVDADGQLLGEHDGDGTHSELWLRMPATGPVRFRVHPYQGSGGGHYTLHIHRFLTLPLGADDRTSGTFGREQWWHYRVALTEGDVLVPTVAGHGRLTAVLDPDRRPLPSVHGGFRAPHDGEYFVRVEGPERRDFTLHTQLARQRQLPADPVHDELPPHGFDIWRVPIHPGQAFVLDLRAPGPLLTVDLVDPDPDQHGPRFVQPGHHDKGGRVFRYHFARRAGTLELRVRNQTPHSAPYQLTVPVQTRPLELDAPTDGDLPLGEGHLYQVDLPSGQLLDLSLHSATFDARLDVWSPDGSVIAQADDRSPLERDARHTFLVDRPGSYRILVHATAAAGSGAYRLRATPQPIPILTPDTPLTVEVPTGGTTHAHLDLKAGQEVWLSVRSGAFDAALTVVDPSGDRSFRREDGGCDRDVLVAYRASHSGRHTLLVHSRDGSGQGELRAIRP